MARFILHHKLIDKVKILTLRTVTNLRTLFDTIYSKSLKLFVHIMQTQCDAVDSTSQNLETGTNQHVQVNIRKSNVGSLYRRVNARDSAIDENLLKKQQKCSRFYRQYIFSALSKANTQFHLNVLEPVCIKCYQSSLCKQKEWLVGLNIIRM